MLVESSVASRISSARTKAEKLSTLKAFKFCPIFVCFVLHEAVDCPTLMSTRSGKPSG